MNQLEKFQSLSSKFQYYAESMRNSLINEWAVPFWKDTHDRVFQYLRSGPHFNFLDNIDIAGTMFAHGHLSKELPYIEYRLSNEFLRRVIKNDSCGKPPSLHNDVHQLYHLVRGVDKGDLNIIDSNTILEWGGGYGCMAKLIRRINPKATYIIVDLPAFSCLQWLYLSTVLDEEINFVLPGGNGIIGRINIMPLESIDINLLNPDLFISTWALSESNAYTQNYVVNHNWFNSKQILLAYQESSSTFPEAGSLHNRIPNTYRIKSEEIEFIPPNKYTWAIK